MFEIFFQMTGRTLNLGLLGVKSSKQKKFRNNFTRRSPPITMRIMSSLVSFIQFVIKKQYSRKQTTVMDSSDKDCGCDVPRKPNVPPTVLVSSHNDSVREEGSVPIAGLGNFPDLTHHNNWMSKCLNMKIYDELKDKKTASGFTMDKAIQTGVDNPGHPFIFTVGCVAGDEESYETLSALFDEVIYHRHNGYAKDALHPTDLDFNKLTGGEGLDPKYVWSCRVRTGRSIRGYSLPPHCSCAERRDVEQILIKALDTFSGKFRGKYYPLNKMTDEEQEKLIDEHFLFDKPVSPLLTCAGMARDWPDARGIWHNDDKNFLVWVNEEDHSRFISMEKGGNMRGVFQRFCDGIGMIETAIKDQGFEFQWNKHLGYILTCPSNLGTGLRAGVHLSCPNLCKDSRFEAILERLHLQKRGTGGVDTEATDGVFDISNLDRLGKSEVELVQLVIVGVELMVQMEKALEKGENIDHLVPCQGYVRRPEESYPDLTKHNNWMAKCLTPAIYHKLKNKETSSGFTFDKVIQTGVDNPGHPFIFTVGCVAGDEETYEVFADLLDPIIEKRHNGYQKSALHKTDLDFKNLEGGDDLDSNYVLSCRVRTGRSIRGYSLPPHNTRGERREVERILREALSTLSGPLKGTYYPLSKMTDAEQQQLIDDHFLFDKPVSPLLTCAGMARDWPDARGIWHNENKNFLVWINEEDHARVISMELGGKMKTVFKRFCEGLKSFEDGINSHGKEFMWNEHLGFILTCPSNLGTGLRAGVHVKLPHMAKHSRFEDILLGLRLQKRGTGGVDTAAEGGVFDISNLDRLGSSEVAQVQMVVNGVKLLIKMEKELEKGGDIQKLIAKHLPKVAAMREPWAIDKRAPLMNSNYPDLSKHSNWMAKCLTKNIFNRIESRMTNKGCVIYDCIQTGVDNPGHPFIFTVGLVAGDEDSYSKFAEIFDPVIERRHNGYTPDKVHCTDLDPSHLKGGELDEEFVLSSRVRTGRSIRGFALPPICNRFERREVERISVVALSALDGPLKGKYYPLNKMTDAEQEQLIDDHFLFDKPVSPLLTCAGMARDWPDARGIWHNENKNFLVWINEEDHLRVISMEKGGNIKNVFNRFCDGLKKVEDSIKGEGYQFMWSEHLGYILTCPSNLGTGLRAGVHVKLPKISADSRFDKILAALRLQKRGTGGVDTASTDGTFDISNLDRLGSSEVQQVQMVVDGVGLLIQMEKRLMAGESVDDLMPEDETVAGAEEA
ncbi:creatine kinase, flagellar-like isoform X2 [Lineus longissimus]|uniref:creatine kinase, flagellar-like isoform X2 n=1 Tax=Lineus longissimus TaxID=88925 RepID=UPI00315C6CB5